MDGATGILLRALAFAAERHSGQRRKDAAASPYINHPIALADVLANEGRVLDVVVLSAAMLHDTIEDTATTAGEIEARFGTRIATVVRNVKIANPGTVVIELEARPHGRQTAGNFARLQLRHTRRIPENRAGVAGLGRRARVGVAKATARLEQLKTRGARGTRKSHQKQCRKHLHRNLPCHFVFPLECDLSVAFLPQKNAHVQAHAKTYGQKNLELRDV